MNQLDWYAAHMREVRDAIGTFITAHLEAHNLEGKFWPPEAEFAVVSRYSTWPVGWQKELNGTPRRNVDFFRSKEDLDKWIHEQHEWARLEDNYVAFQAYRWDWGPVPMEESRYSYNIGSLR